MRKEMFVYPDGRIAYFELPPGLSVDIQERSLTSGKLTTPERRQPSDQEVTLIKSHGADKLRFRSGKLQFVGDNIGKDNQVNQNEPTRSIS